MAVAEQRCSDDGARFTDLRRKVFEILLEAERPMGAYAILDQLRDAGFSSQPPVAYRALEFLIAHDLAHKVERLNAFIACVNPGQTHAPAFMICRLCDDVAEAQAEPARGVLGVTARAAGFQIEQTMVEALGVCPSCVDRAETTNK
jgi:Fur family zinc uptake transcriptional regulator